MSEWTEFHLEAHCPECGEWFSTDDIIAVLDARNRYRGECYDCGAKVEFEAKFDVEWRTRKVEGS